MKTSTKLLIILFISVPATMFAYNWLLVNEYHAGNLTLQWTLPTKENRELPAFKHVVMDGRLHHSKGTRPLEGILLDLASQPVQKPQLIIPDQFNENVITNVINDTLYISYHKENVDEEAYITWGYDRLYLFAPKINSVTLSYGNYLITHLGTDSLRLQANNASVSVNNLNVTTLSAIANGLSTIHIYANNKIEQLEYSIPNKDGKLEMDHNASQSYKPGKIHPEAQLMLIGKAPEMQKYIIP